MIEDANHSMVDLLSNKIIVG